MQRYRGLQSVIIVSIHRTGIEGMLFEHRLFSNYINYDDKNFRDSNNHDANNINLVNSVN